MLRVVGALALMQLFGAVLAVLNSLILARELGLAELGLYSAALAAANVLGLAAWLGFPTLVTAKNATSALSPAIRHLVALHILIASALVGAVLWVLADPMMDIVPSAARSLLFFIPARAVLMVSRGVLIGGGRTRTATVVGDVSPQLFVAVQLVSIDFSSSLDAARFTAISYILAASAALFLAWRSLRVTDSGRGDLLARSFVRSTYKESLALTGTSWLRSFQENVPVLALSWIATSGPSTAGAFRLAQRGASLSQLPVSACISWLSPQVPTLKGRPAELGRLLRRAGLFSVTASLCALLAAAIFADPVIARLLGPEFTAAVGPLLVLQAGCVGRHFWPYPLLVLNYTGNAPRSFRVQVCALLASCGGLAILIPVAGATGAALGVVLGWILNSYLGARVCRHVLGLDVRSFATGLLESKRA